jgi:uncharacterized protein with HEPN domain
MTPEERAVLRILHMRDAIQALERMLADHRPSAIQADPTLIRAFERWFEIMSEASRHIPQDLKGSEPDIPWRDIASIGNILRHDYDGVDFKVLLAIAIGDMADLDAALARILDRLPPL